MVLCEPFDLSGLVDECEFALASVGEVALAGLPCEYRVAAVGFEPALCVGAGDAVVRDEAGAPVFPELERVSVFLAHLAVGG